jgi:general secretion pathway protein G
MKSLWLGSTLCYFSASFAFAQDSGSPADFAGAVPTDAFALVRLRSARELTQRIEEVRVKGAISEQALDEQALLRIILDDVKIKCDAALIDATRPIGLAFSFAMNSPEPVPTIILPATDAKALTDSLVSGDTQVSAQPSGSYVALSMRAATARGDKPSRVARGDPAGILTARVDLAAIVTKFRPVIDMGLDQLEQMADSGRMKSTNQPFDMSEMVEMYAEFGRDAVDSVDLLDASLDMIGPELSLSLSLSNREGSALAKFAYPEKVDYRALATKIDPGSVLQFIWSYDQAAWFTRMMPVYENAFTAMEKAGTLPAEFTAGFQAYLKHLKELVPKYGRTAAGSFDLDQAGMRMSVSYATPDPRGLLQSVLSMTSDPALAALGLATGAPTEIELAGVKATSFSANFDIRKMLKLLLPPVNAAAASEREADTFEQILAGVFGKDGARVALLAGADRLGVLFGGDDTWRSNAARRLSSGGDASPGLLRAVDSISGSNPAMLVRADLGRGLAGVATWMPTIQADAAAIEQVTEVWRRLGSAPIPACMYWGVHGSTWKLGASIDYEGLLRMIKARDGSQGAEKRRSRVNFEVRAIDDAVKRYARDHKGAQPDSLDVLLQPDASGKPCLRFLPKDPWGRAYLYEKKSDDKSRRVYSLGADGQPGGSGENADCDNLNSTSPSIDDLVLPPGNSKDQ